MADNLDLEQITLVVDWLNSKIKGESIPMKFKEEFIKKRRKALNAAISFNLDTGNVIPEEWVKEYNSLITDGRVIINTKCGSYYADPKQ